jgi:hypothetical protein
MGAMVLVFVIRAGCAEVAGHKEQPMGDVKKDFVLGGGIKDIGDDDPAGRKPDVDLDVVHDKLEGHLNAALPVLEDGGASPKGDMAPEAYLVASPERLNKPEIHRQVRIPDAGPNRGDFAREALDPDAPLGHDLDDRNFGIDKKMNAGELEQGPAVREAADEAEGEASRGGSFWRESVTEVQPHRPRSRVLRRTASTPKCMRRPLHWSSQKGVVAGLWDAIAS